MIIKEIFSRDYIDSCIADMEAIGYEYNGTDNRGRLVFDSKDGNSSQAFPDWEDVRYYLDNGATPFDLDAYLKKDVNECDKVTIKEETEEDIVEYRLEAADYAMYKVVQCSYVEIVSDNTFGKYEVRYNNATVTVEFELSEDTAKYVYTIDGEGPYAHDSYEYIRRDIMDYIDTHFEDEDDLDESCIKEEDSSKADDIDFIMNKYVDNKPVSGSYGSYDKIEIIDNKGKGKYTVSCNGYSVDIDFDLDDDSARYVYYIEGEGPYAHNSYEYITKDIAHYIDWAVKHYGEDDDLDESQCLTEASLPDWQDTIMLEIRNILKNNRIYADIYDDTDFRGDDDAFVLCVEIENGDWKHEHKKADILITDTVNHYDNMEITKIGEETIGDSEDDTYSSIHKFHIIRYPDDNGFDFDDIEQLDIKFPKRESKNRSRRNRKRVNEARYSDVIPYENRKYWYFTTHGIGPGTIPKGVKILDVKEGQNKKGTWGDFICLDAILNTSELKDFDLIELAPDNVYESNNNRTAFKVGDKVNSKLTATTISFNDGTIIDIDKDGLCTIECADGTVIDGIRQNTLVKSYTRESADMKNCYSEHYLSEVNNNTEEQELAEFLDWLKDENIKVVKVADKLKTIYLYDEKDLDEASFYLQDRDYFKKLYDFGWQVAVQNKSLGRKLAKTLKMESVELDGFTYNDTDIVEALAYMYGISYEEVHNALKNNEFTDNEIKRAITYWNLDGYNPKEKQAEYNRRCKELGICEEVEHTYRVWYRPYGLDGDEEDYIDVTASNEEEARRFARTCGNDTDVELLESKQLKVAKALKMESKTIKENRKEDLKRFADANKDKLSQLAQKNGFRLYNDYYYRNTYVDRNYTSVLCFDFDEVNSKADIDKFERALDRYFNKLDYNYFLELLPRVKRICIYY